jgi:hypothetical protein
MSGDHSSDNLGHDLISPEIGIVSPTLFLDYIRDFNWYYAPEFPPYFSYKVTLELSMVSP